jgi:transcriptional regulator with XRE-family HTH domain
MLVKELAVKTGISRHTPDNYLNVRENMPTADIAVKIAKTLGVSVEYLVIGEDSQTEKFTQRSKARALIQNFNLLSEKDQKMIIAITQLIKDHDRNGNET